MAKLEQNRGGLFPGGKHGSTGRHGVGKVKNTVKRKAGELKRAIGDVASNIKKGRETRKTEKATEEIAAMGSNKNPRFLQDTQQSQDQKTFATFFNIKRSLSFVLSAAATSGLICWSIGQVQSDSV